MSWKERFLEHLHRIAFFAEYQGENPFKIRAFNNALDVLGDLEDEVLQREIHSGELIERKGIGKGILHIAQGFLKTKKSQELLKIQGELPDSLFDLRQVKGLGVKKIKALYEGLQIKSLGELEYACNENRLVSLEGFGTKTQAKIVSEIQKLKARSTQHLLPDAMAKEAEIRKQLRELSYQLLAIGDLGRKAEVVRNFEFAIEEPNLKRAADAFSQIETVSHLKLDKNLSKIHFNLRGLPHVSIYCRSRESLIPFEVFKTSSPSHWQALQTFAQKKNENLTTEGLGKPFTHHSQFYEALGLSDYPPESREFAPNTKEKWKPLLTKQLTGAFHLHTVFSDGINTLNEMAEAARKLGWRYFGVSDHSVTAAYARGLTEDDLESQWEEVEAWNKKWGDEFFIFKGVESDILKDGSLDYKTHTLKKFDFVIASIHSRYGMTEMTHRLIRAIENPHTTMIGHISGRLLLARDPYAFDVDKVVDAAIQNKVVIELNSNPQRLDLRWEDLARACEKGLVISINPDAHSAEALRHIDYGVWFANKARVPAEQILNTWPLEKIQKFFESKS